MNVSGRLPHMVSLLDIRLQTPLPNIIVLRGNDAEAEGVTVSGRVVLSLNDSISVKSIMFHFYGVNKVKYCFNCKIVQYSGRLDGQKWSCHQPECP